MAQPFPVASVQRPSTLAAADVAAMDYVDFIALIRETNRCPGGLPSVRRVASASGIDRTSTVLEIGSNTGFTSLELVKLTGCRVTGIEPNRRAVAEAERRRALLPPALRERVRFEVGDARHLDQADGSIDVIVCGGVNSFIEDRAGAFAEYERVLRELGRLTITSFFYRSAPPLPLRRRLRAIIGVEIPPWDQATWLRTILDGSDWEVLSLEARPAVARGPAIVERYVDHIVAQEHLRQLPVQTVEAIRRRWLEICLTFDANHHYVGILELVVRRPLETLKEQAQLFLAPGEYDRWFTHDLVGEPSAPSGLDEAIP